ncbi:Oidioi.mRNA.OKI2018_I69.XSR.g14518.t1.cds [Oikopleura dioica]|uniref:Oidioi.mRNA.OKI2018_I69.XSR.g14518.t1.cds n=1 Tax=Oikopleura dioica TaxID=34765 RepID=A0ABN7SAJ9_OIKDI|nr:Oidioi.mRNA.OKI2018_I69.XSR.g14518.t1.cds [Oikopleura dioica]
MSHNVDWSDTSADPESICDNFLLLPTLVGILICLGRVLDQFFRKSKSNATDFILVPSRAATFDKKQMWPVCGSFAVIAAAASVYGELVVAPQSRISTSRQSLLFNQDVITKSPVLSPLNFRLWTSAHATLVYDNLTRANNNLEEHQNVDLDFSLNFLQTNTVTGAIAHERDYTLIASRNVDCQQNYSAPQEVTLIDCKNIQLYSKRSLLEREVLQKMNMTARDKNLSISDVTLAFSTVNPKFTQTLIWLRFGCLLATFLATIIFLASLKRLEPSQRSAAHKWVLALFITLLLYQDPLFPLFFLLKWESLELIDELLQISFFRDALEPVLSLTLLYWFFTTQDSGQSKIPPNFVISFVACLGVYTVVLRMLEHLLHLDSYSIWLPSRGLTLILNAAWLVLLICVIASLIYRTDSNSNDDQKTLIIRLLQIKNHPDVELRRRLSSFDGKDDPRRGYLRTAEHSASALSDKSCHLITSLKNRVNMGGYTGSGSPRRHNMEYASGSLGRKPRVPPKPCPSQIALAEAIKTLNTLAESLHKETKCLRGEISELYDKFEEDDQTAVTKDEQQQRQLSELSRYVKILEYRLLKAQKLDEQSSVDVEAHLNLQNEVERLEMRARADQEENRELYLQILQLRTNERALKEDNKRLLNQLDHLSLHGRSVSPDREESLIAPEYRSETDKANGLLQAEIEVLKESLQEMNKLNKDLKDKLLFYQQSRSSTSEEPILISQLRQLEQDNEDLKTKLDYLQTTDTEFLEEEMLVLQSTVKELEIENDRLKRLSNPDLTDLQPLQDELQKLKTENANLRSGVQNKIHLKSAIRSMLTDQTLRRSSSSERSFIARRGIFELLPVLSVREEVFRVQRLSNKLLSALRKQQSDIPLSAISAEARALAAETALLVKKYGVLEEQVQTLIKELKQVQIAPSHVSTAANEINEDEFIV